MCQRLALGEQGGAVTALGLAAFLHGDAWSAAPAAILLAAQNSPAGMVLGSPCFVASRGDCCFKPRLVVVLTARFYDAREKLEMAEREAEKKGKVAKANGTDAAKKEFTCAMADVAF